MEFATTQADGATVLHVEGSIQARTAAEFESQALKAAQASTDRFVLDMTKVDYLSSAGLRVIAILINRFKDAPDKLAICGVIPPVRQVLDLTGLLPKLTVFDDVESATRVG